MGEGTQHPGQLVRDERRRAGITQQQLALRAGTSQAAVSRIERGGPSPSCDTLDRLLRVMGMRLELCAVVRDEDIDIDIDIEEIRRARAMPVEQRLQRAFAWNAFAARVSGVAQQRRSES